MKILRSLKKIASFFLNPRIVRILLFLALIGILLIFTYLITGSVLPNADTKNLWFYSGIFMVLFSMFFIEPYYTAPTNVIANATSLLLVLISIKSDFSANLLWWNIGFFYLLTILIISVISTVLKDSEKSPEHWQNVCTEWLKKYCCKFWGWKICFFRFLSLFFVFLLLNTRCQDSNSIDFLVDYCCYSSSKAY